MFGTVSSGLSLTKVIGGISKTLSIANQVIPLYREAKPMIQNAKTILSVLKDVGKPSNKNKENIKNNIDISNNNNKSVRKIPATQNNSPVFFL